MATPTPMKHAASQQGKTPLQSQHGAAASPPISTPFSASLHAAFSPQGPRSSPQQFKKSPATSTTLTGQPVNAMGFDSPSAAAAIGALGIGGGLDIGLDGVGSGALGGGMGKVDDDERARRLESVVAILSERRGLVSEAGLEGLAKRAGLECLWEDGMGGGESKSRTLIVAGSALELLIVMSGHVVRSVSLAFPESPHAVTRHTDRAGQILLEDLQLRPGQSPLTRRLAKFAANFDRLAVLDKHSVNPGLNLYEAVAGVYESLVKIYQWDLDKARQDPALAGRGDDFVASHVLCTRNGAPAMHARDRVGLSLDYWKEGRLVAPTSDRLAAFRAETGLVWGVLVSCAPMGSLALPPVRISDQWVSAAVGKSVVDDPQLGPAAEIDWLLPESTIIPAANSNAKAEPDVDSSGDTTAMAGPKLPEVVFMATLDPPLHVPLLVWQQIRQLGGDLTQPELTYTTLDGLMFPVSATGSGGHNDPSELRTITRTKAVAVKPEGGDDLTTRSHKNTLYIYKPVYGKTLEEIPFSHPQQLLTMLPFLRQYAFLSALLDKSFGGREEEVSSKVTKTGNASTTREDDFAAFMAGAGASETVAVDVTLNVHPIPRLQVVFPFRSATANVVLEIRPNGEVHVESQNVLDESNATAPNGRQRRPEDLGKMLETAEDIGKWCEFIRTRWQ